MPTTLQVGFLGNCFDFGYRGVVRRDTYPEVAKRRLEAERPGLRVNLQLDGVYHPADLARHAGRLLARRPPDILVVDTAANLVAEDHRQPVDLLALPAPVAGLAEGARLGRALAKRLATDHRAFGPVIETVERAGRLLVDRAGLPFLRRHARPTIDEYEGLLRDAILQIGAARSTTLIVQGPSVFNPDESDELYRPETLDLYRAVNAMVRRVTTAHGALMVDRQGVAGGAGRSIFLDGRLRLSVAGHELMGQALAETILRSGLI